jgi:RimJ/RimL family protein N-acetyltransferase
MDIISKSGKKITIRQPHKNDLDELYRYAVTISNEDTFIRLNPKEPVTLVEEKEILESWIKKNHNKTHLQLFAFDDKKLIGMIGVTLSGRRQKHRATMGISIAKEYRDDGIGTKLMEHAIAIAKQQWQLSLLTLTCMAINKRGLAVYKKLGFQQFGLLPSAMEFQGTLIDEIYMFKQLS